MVQAVERVTGDQHPKGVRLHQHIDVVACVNERVGALPTLLIS